MNYSNKSFPNPLCNAANARGSHLNAINATDTRKYSRQSSSKRCALLQILHQIIHIVQVSRQQVLLLLCGSRNITLAIGTLSTSAIICTVIECACKLTRASLQHCRDGNSTACRGDGGRFGHEVEVQKLDELKLNFSACFSGLEEASYCQEAIEVLKGTGILRGFDESAYKGDDGCGLDGRAVDGFEEVK
jgi:hypothetical protein